MNGFEAYAPNKEPAPDDLLEESIESKGLYGDCPKCREPFNDSDVYIVNNSKWPRYYNWKLFQSDWGDTYTWTEFHRCNRCATIFRFEGGN